MPGFPAPKTLAANGVELQVHELGEGLPVVLCHGWPELAYSWSRQLPALAAAGYRAIAPTQRGFPGSSAPAAVEAYDAEHLTGDLAGLLDALGLDRAVFCGHDWGGLVVWHMAMLRPDRVAGVIGVNTPHQPRLARPPIKTFRAAFGPDFYIVRFQAPGEAEAAFETDPERFFEFMFRKPPPKEIIDALPTSVFNLIDAFKAFGGAGDDELVVSRADLSVYADAFARAGFAGGINWYRNFDRNYALTEGVSYTIDKPCLMITAELDVALPPALAKDMPDVCPDLEMHMIEGCGHWTQWEKPDELNRMLIDWLTRRFPPAAN